MTPPEHQCWRVPGREIVRDRVEPRHVPEAGSMAHQHKAGHRACRRSGSGWVGDPLLRTPPRRAWFDDYYDVRGPRATQLRTQPDTAVRELAEDTLTEIDIFRRCDGDYGYVFFALRRV
jgi:hypothetical protein